MKKILTCALTVIVLVGCVLGLTACKGYRTADKMAKILIELNANTADIGIMDSIMANYYVSKDTNFSTNLQIIEDLVLSEEDYGIGMRKGSAGIDRLNSALSELYKNGKMNEIATVFNLTGEVKDCSYQSKWDNIEDKSDWEYIVNKKKFVIGYTKFMPIADFVDGQLDGYDIRLAKAVGEMWKTLYNEEIAIEFKEIVWSAKEMELTTKNIDCIWNGMTITEERKNAMEISLPYLQNKQVALIRKADKDLYTKDLTTFAEARLIAEAGSAGEAIIKKEILPKIKK